EISGIVLQRLKAAAEDFLGEPVTEAIITVPAYFDDTQRQGTTDAGKRAGLRVERIIHEPARGAGRRRPRGGWRASGSGAQTTSRRPRRSPTGSGATRPSA